MDRSVLVIPPPVSRANRRGHALVEALVAMTVLLLCSAMIAHTALTALRVDDAWRHRAMTLDIVNQQIAERWVAQCAGWTRASAEATASRLPGRLQLSEEAHPELGDAGGILRGRWTGLPSDRSTSHELVVSVGIWCGR